MNFEEASQASGTSEGANDTNGNPPPVALASSSSSSVLATTASTASTGSSTHNLGARPKIRSARNVINVVTDQVVPHQDHVQEDNDDNEDATSDDDFYVYRYTGNGLSSHNIGDRVLSFDDDDPLEVADLPKSFYQLDVGGSDSEASSLPRSLGGVSGAGQSNLSTEVAALIQSEMASQSQRRQRLIEQRPQAANLRQQRPESPDMDFLEMDFDPGDEDSEQCSEDESETPELIQRPQELRLEVIEEPEAKAPVENHAAGNVSAPLQSPASVMELCSSMTRSRSLNSPLANGTCHLDASGSAVARHKRRHSGEDGLCTASSSSSASMSAEVNMELCGARLSQREALVFGVPGSTNVHRAMLKLRMLDIIDQNHDSPSVILRTSEDKEQPVRLEKTMIWTELEACKRQVNQIGVSACGATALINVLQALDYPYITDQVTKMVPTKLRAESAPIPDYLLSRSMAGTSHQDLIESMSQITEGQVCGRFFSFYPERKVSLSHWLAHWLNLGAVPVATLNLQKGLLPGQNIPDAWHHQMIFGVSHNGVYLTNPLESVSECILNEQLCSNSELLVRRSDIVSRWHPTCDLSILAEVEHDERWDSFNVLGQVVDLLREEHQRPPPTSSQQQQSPSSQNPATASSSTSQNVQKSHVRIPAIYQSGITLFVNKSANVECHHALMSSAELPLKPK